MNQRSGNNNNVNIINPTTYEEEWTKLSFVLELRVKYFNNHLAFYQFLEKAYYHIVMHYKDKGDLDPPFHDMADPTTTMESRHKPKKPEADDSDKVDLEIYKEEIKQFVH